MRPSPVARAVVAELNTAPIAGTSLALAYQFIRGEQPQPASLSNVDSKERAA